MTSHKGVNIELESLALIRLRNAAHSQRLQLRASSSLRASGGFRNVRGVVRQVRGMYCL